MDQPAPDPTASTSRSLAARDAAGMMLGLAALLRRRSFDEDEVDPRLVDTTVRRLRRVGVELLGADEDGRSEQDPAVPPDGVAWATQLAWLLSHGRVEPGTRSALERPDERG